MGKKPLDGFPEKEFQKSFPIEFSMKGDLISAITTLSILLKNSGFSLLMNYNKSPHTINSPTTSISQRQPEAPSLSIYHCLALKLGRMYDILDFN